MSSIHGFLSTHFNFSCPRCPNLRYLFLTPTVPAKHGQASPSRISYLGFIKFSGLSPPDLTRLPLKMAEDEMVDSKKIIEDTLGTPVGCFAYPNGRYNNKIRDIVKNYFAFACTDQLGWIHTKSDLYTLKRVDAYYLRTEKLFGIMPTGWFSLYIRACSIPRWARRVIQYNPN